MDWTFAHLAIAFGGAFVAGMINALAGNGSVITLTILTELLGVSGNIANGTNRVGVLMNAAGALTGFRKNDQSHFSRRNRYILPVVFGAIAGIYTATIVTDAQFLWVFRILMIVMLFVILAKPEKWFITVPEKSLLPGWMELPLMLILGFYGGFIQMGMGVFYLAFLVLIARIPMIDANAIKALAVGIFTTLAVLIFALNGQVIWLFGLVMGVGQFFGGWFSAYYVSKVPGSAKLAYYVLIIAVLLSLLRLFDIL